MLVIVSESDGFDDCIVIGRRRFILTLPSNRRTILWPSRLRLNSLGATTFIGCLAMETVTVGIMLLSRATSLPVLLLHHAVHIR